MGSKDKRVREDSNSPPFGPPVLEPSLDLRVRHLQVLGQGRSFRRGQVLLLVEPFLQLTNLDKDGLF